MTDLNTAAERVRAAVAHARISGQRHVSLVTVEDAEALVAVARWGPLPLWQRTLLGRLEEGADLSTASRDAGVTRMTYYRALRREPAFRSACASVFRAVGYRRLRLRLDESA